MYEVHQSLDDLLSHPDGYFRRCKAEEFPDDQRNSNAAEIMDRIAAQLPTFEGSDLHEKVDRLVYAHGDNADYTTKVVEAISQASLDVGFRSGVDDAKSYIEDVISRLEEVLASASDS